MEDSVTTEIIASGGNLFIVKATLKTGNQEFTSLGSNSSPVDAEDLAIKRVYQLAGISKAGVTDK